MIVFVLRHIFIMKTYQRIQALGGATAPYCLSDKVFAEGDQNVRGDLGGPELSLAK